MKTETGYYKSYSGFVMTGIVERDHQIDEEAKKLKAMLNVINNVWSGTIVVRGEILCLAMDIVEMTHKQIVESERIIKTICQPSIYLLFEECDTKLWELRRSVEDTFKNSNERRNRVEVVVGDVPFAKYIDYWEERSKDSGKMDDEMKELINDIDFTNLEMELLWTEGNDYEKAAKIFATIDLCLSFAISCLINKTSDIFDNNGSEGIIEEGAKTFCCMYREEEEARLIRQMNSERFKKENTEEDWCEMRIKEEGVIRSVVYGGMTSETERTIKEFYDDEIMNNVELMEEFNRCLPHEGLLDVQEVIDEVDLLLRHYNVYLFYRMMLRFDIIQYHIYGEGMKREFEEWMGVAKRNKSDRSEEELRGSNEVLQTGGKLGSMVSFYALIKEVSGWISKNYEWYAVYRFLRDYSYLKMYNVSKFCGQMTGWFGGGDAKGCKNDDVSRYNKFLGNYNFEEWRGISDEECKKVDKKLNSGAVGKIHELYKRMKEKYDDL